MADEHRLIELRFDRNAVDCFEESMQSLSTLDVERSRVARDPTIVAALTIASAAVSLVIELVKLAKELKTKGKKQGILLVKVDKNNDEKTLALLEASESDIRTFVEDE
jgi:hypothetical protein